MNQTETAFPESVRIWDWIFRKVARNKTVRENFAKFADSLPAIHRFCLTK
jgi:hypothetical protein